MDPLVNPVWSVKIAGKYTQVRDEFLRGVAEELLD